MCRSAPLYNCVGAGLFHTGQTGNNDDKSVLARLGFTASKTETVFGGFLPLILEPVMQAGKLDTLEYRRVAWHSLQVKVHGPGPALDKVALAT